jgi:Bacterial regulatory proteins, luxR family
MSRPTTERPDGHCWPPPLSSTERAALGEDYFRDCFKLALHATLGLAAIAIVLAFADQQRGGAGATVVIASLTAVLVLRGYRGGYESLSRHPYRLAWVGAASALSSLWPAVDANATYFPTLAPLALIACVAHHNRERVAITVALAGGTLAAAILDSRAPYLREPGQLAAATIAVLVLGGLLCLVVDWWARRVLFEPDGDASTSPADLAEVSQLGEVEPAVEHAGPDWVMVGAVVAASPRWFAALRPRGFDALTGRELQIVYLIRDQLAPADIASYLCISKRTVDVHIDHIRRKLDATYDGRSTFHLALGLPPLRQLPLSADGRSQ